MCQAGGLSGVKPAFHDADTDTDILVRMSARMSVSVSWNAGLTVERSLATKNVAGSNLSQSASVWASCSHACAFVNKQYNLVPAYRRWRSLVGKVTASLVESIMATYRRVDRSVTCGLTTCTLASVPGPTLGNECMWETLTLYVASIGHNIWCGRHGPLIFVKVTKCSLEKIVLEIRKKCNRRHSE